MSKAERQRILSDMHERTKRATASKEAAIQYLIELGALTKNGNYKKRFRPACTTSKAA
jgi:hypothetical protein